MIKIQAGKRMLAFDEKKLSSEIFDFFRHNFTSYKDLEKNGMKAIQQMEGRPHGAFNFPKNLTRNYAPIVRNMFNRAAQEMYTASMK